MRLEICAAQRAGFRLTVLPGGAVKGDAHYLVAVFLIAGKAVDGELQGVEPRHKRAAVVCLGDW